MQTGDAFADVTAFSRERARPLAPDDRREAILTAVLPLLREQGRDVSSRQLAEAAGVAEGTLFRAFGDKETLISAAIAKIFDHLPLMAALRGIDHGLPLEAKLEEVIRLLNEHFRGVIGAFAVFRLTERPPVPDDLSIEHRLVDVLADLLEPDLKRLAVPVDVVAQYLRLVAFASSMPIASGLDRDVLSGLIARGILRREREN